MPVQQARYFHVKSGRWGLRDAALRVGSRVALPSPFGGLVKYLPPFDLIRRMVEVSTVRGELRVSLSYEDFVKILRLMISGMEVDEAWYLREYEDIARAVQSGRVTSARQHFVNDGYFEGRLPF